MIEVKKVFGVGGSMDVVVVDGNYERPDEGKPEG